MPKFIIINNINIITAIIIIIITTTFTIITALQMLSDMWKLL